MESRLCSEDYMYRGGGGMFHRICLSMSCPCAVVHQLLPSPFVLNMCFLIEFSVFKNFP